MCIYNFVRLLFVPVRSEALSCLIYEHLEILVARKKIPAMMMLTLFN